MSNQSVTRRTAQLLTEFLVIVVGVFIALAMESWWSERQDRMLERELRQDMVAEFASNIAILESDLAENQAASDHFARLAAISDEALLALSDDHLNASYRPFPEWAGFDPEMGIVQALVSSGNLNSISDQELRLRLSRWAGLLAEKSRKTLQATTFQINTLVPVVAEAADDGVWSPTERRQVQTIYQTMSRLHLLAVNNQQRLLEEAKALRAYLASES